MLVEYESRLEAYHVQYKANDGSRSCVMAWAGRRLGGMG